MKKQVEKMITFLFPEAIPDKDFEVKIMADQTASIVSWNSIKLGANPGLPKMREIYMRHAKKRKEVVPEFDDSDPLPYMAEKARRVIEFPRQRAEIIDGLSFTKVR